MAFSNENEKPKNTKPEQQNTNTSLKTIIKLIIEIILFYIIFQFYYSQSRSFYFKSKAICPNFLISKLINKDFTIIIHSSERTKSRLDQYLTHYIKYKKHIHIIVAYGKNSTPDPRFDHLITPCADTRDSLDCKNGYVYNFFLENPNLGDFLYRGIDDTIINITNLEKLIQQLRTIYNPKTDIVFRGFANDEFREKVYLGGGSGWLMSRAMVSIHNYSYYSFQVNTPHAFWKQDDTSESIIVRKIGFKSLKAWRDPRWAENGNVELDLSNVTIDEFFNKLDNCSRNVDDLVPVNQMIAMHATFENLKRNWILSQKYPYNSYNNIYVYKLPYSQFSKMCKAEPGIINRRITLNYLKENAEFIKLSELLVKKNYQFDYKYNYIDNK